MEITFDRVVAVFGIALAIVLVVLDKAGKLRGPVLFWLLALAGLMCLPLALGNSWVKETPWGMLKFSKVMLMASIIVMAYSILAIWISSPSEIVAEHPPPEKPQLQELALGFVYPKAPALIIKNPSDTLARDIKWTVALWNMDVPERNDPLPIPVSTFDWIKPHDEGGPQDLFGSALVAPLLKQGNRLFGSASVTCPECARGRTYIVYIVWGDSGWFAEVESEKTGKVIVPSNFLRETREAYFRQLEAMAPKESRIQITPLSAVPVVQSKPAIKWQFSYEGQQAMLSVTNTGDIADVWAPLRIDGLVNARREDIFACWTHTQSVKERIAKGQTCRLLLATLEIDRPNLLLATWTIPYFFNGKMNVSRAWYSSLIGNKDVQAEDIHLYVSLFTDPDCAEVTKKCHVVLHPTSAEELSD